MSIPETQMPSKIATRRSAIHGNGMFAIAPIKKGERLIEYKGQRRTHAEVDAGDTGDVDSGHTFLFTLNDEYVIDANHNGNAARWINHSCMPNCEAVLEEDDGDDRRKDKVFIEAIRAIAAGEELSYNYGIRLEEKHTAALKKVWECRCGSPGCTGTMLQPKSEKKKKKQEKLKKLKVKEARKAKEAGVG
ncbi:SET domain-containing protein-lysine N-methyltransferase [Lysobacter fragariae]